MTAVLLLGLAAALIGLGLAGRRNERARRAAAAATVELVADGDGVRRVLADGRREEIRWDEVTEVEVITTAVGIHADDGVLLVLAGDEERGCLIPSRLAVEHRVIEALHALPGFDGRRLVAAMGQPPPARTTCWERAPQ